MTATELDAIASESVKMLRRSVIARLISKPALSIQSQSFLLVSSDLQQALCDHVPVCGPRAFLPLLQMIAAIVAGPELCPDEGRVRCLARLDSPPEAHVIALFVTLDTEPSSNN